MQTNRTRLALATLAGVTLCGVVSARMTSAQGPGGQASGEPGQNYRAPGSVPRGFAAQQPFIAGTIAGTDSNTGRIMLQASFGGNARIVQATNATRIVAQNDVAIGDLQVNDSLQVQGVPTGITASAMTAGQVPEFLRGGILRPAVMAPGAPMGGANTGPFRIGAETAFASASGHITSIHPLTLSLGNDVSLTIKPAAGARVTRIMPIRFNDLKVGDRVAAMGHTENDGSFVATGIAVNTNPGLGAAPGGVNPNGVGPGGFSSPGARLLPGGPGAPGSGGPTAPGGQNGSGN